MSESTIWKTSPQKGVTGKQIGLPTNPGGIRMYVELSSIQYGDLDVGDIPVVLRSGQSQNGRATS